MSTLEAVEGNARAVHERKDGPNDAAERRRFSEPEGESLEDATTQGGSSSSLAPPLLARKRGTLPPLRSIPSGISLEATSELAREHEADAVAVPADKAAVVAAANDMDRSTTAGSGSGSSRGGVQSPLEGTLRSCTSPAGSGPDDDDDGPLAATLQSGGSNATDEFSFGTTKPAMLPPPSCLPSASRESSSPDSRSRQVASAPFPRLSPTPVSPARTPQRSPRRTPRLRGDSDEEDGPEFTFGTTAALQLPDVRHLPLGPPQPEQPSTPSMASSDGLRRASLPAIPGRPLPAIRRIDSDAGSPSRLRGSPHSVPAQDLTLAIQPLRKEQEEWNRLKEQEGWNRQQQQQQQHEQLMHLQHNHLMQQYLQQQQLLQQEQLKQQQQLMHMQNAQLQTVIEGTTLLPLNSVSAVVASPGQVTSWQPYVDATQACNGNVHYSSDALCQSWSPELPQQPGMVCQPWAPAEELSYDVAFEDPHKVQNVSLSYCVDIETEAEGGDGVFEENSGELDPDSKSFGSYPSSPKEAVMVELTCNGELARRMVAASCMAILLAVVAVVGIHFSK